MLCGYDVLWMYGSVFLVNFKEMIFFVVCLVEVGFMLGGGVYNEWFVVMSV